MITKKKKKTCEILFHLITQLCSKLIFSNKFSRKIFFFLLYLFILLLLLMYSKRIFTERENTSKLSALPLVKIRWFCFLIRLMIICCIEKKSSKVHSFKTFVVISGTVCCCFTKSFKTSRI